MPLMSIKAGCITISKVQVSELSEGTFLLEAEPALFFGAESDEEAESFPRFGDTFQAEKVDAGTLRYLNVQSRGPYRHYEFTLPATLASSAALNDFLDSVAAEGGHWVHLMGGVLLLAVPKDSLIDPRAALLLNSSDP